MKRTLSCPSCGVALEIDNPAPGETLACPSCGQPFSVPAVRVARVARVAAPAAPVDVRVRGTVTTQRTSKKWKVIALFGFLLLAGGIVGGIAAQWEPGGWIAVIVLAVVLRGIARVGRWWTND